MANESDIPGIRLKMESFDTTTFDETAWKQQWVDAGYEKYFNRAYKNSTFLFDPELSMSKSLNEINGVRKFFLMVPDNS
jgi:hypothetical protein